MQNLSSSKSALSVFYPEDELELDDLRLKFLPLSGDRDVDRERDDDDLPLRRGERDLE